MWREMAVGDLCLVVDSCSRGFDLNRERERQVMNGVLVVTV